MADDRQIQLKIGLDAKNAEKTAEELQDEIKQIFETRGSDNSSASLTQLELQMKKNTESAEQLKNALNDLYQTKGNIETFNEDSQTITKVSDTLNEVKAKIQELQSTKVNFFDEMLSTDEIQARIAEVEERLQGVNDEIKNTQEAISMDKFKLMDAESLGDASKIEYYQNNIKLAEEQLAQLGEYQATYQQQLESFDAELERAGRQLESATTEFNGQQMTLEQLNAVLGETQQKYDSISERMTEMEQKNPKIGDAEYQQKVQAEINKTEMSLDGVNDKLKQQIIRYSELQSKGAPAVNTTNREMQKLKKSTEQVRKVSSDTSKTMSVGFGDVTKKLKHLVMRLGVLFLGVRGITSMFMRLRSAVLEGFKNLQESGVGKLKKEMNDLHNATTTLKNTLAGAFEPIVTTIIPYIQRLVEWLTIAIDKLAQFIAAMKGQSTYIRAIKQVGNAGEKASKQLAKFDELNILNSPKGNGAAGMFEEAAIPSDMLDKVDAFKQKLEEIKAVANEIVIQPFKEGFTEAIGDWQSRVASIRENAKTIQQSLIDIFSSPEVQKSVTNFAKTISRTLGQVVGANVRFGLNLADNLTGGFSQFLNDNKARIQEDIANTFNLSSDIVGTYGDLAQAFGEISDALNTKEAKNFTESLIDLGYTFGSETVQFALKVIRDLFDVFASPIIENVDAIRDSLTEFFESITPAIVVLKQSVEETFNAINAVYDAYIAPLLADAKHLISELIVSIMPIINEIAKIISLIMQIAQVVQEKLQPVIDEIVDVWGPKITFIINFISGLVQAVAKVIVDVIYYVLRTLRFVFEAIYDLITGDVEGLFNDFMSFCDDINARVQEALQWLADLFVEKWEVCKNAVQDFKDAVARIIDAITAKFDGFKDKIQAVVDKIKGLVDVVTGGAFGGVLSTLDSIGDKGTTSSTSTRNIPFGGGMASGGVIPPTASEHLIMVGDNHQETEVVSPLSTMQEAMINALNAVGVGGEGQPINIYLGTEKIYSEIRKMEKRYNLMGG